MADEEGGSSARRVWPARTCTTSSPQRGSRRTIASCWGRRGTCTLAWRTSCVRSARPRSRSRAVAGANSPVFNCLPRLAAPDSLAAIAGGSADAMFLLAVLPTRWRTSQTASRRGVLVQSQAFSLRGAGALCVDSGATAPSAPPSLKALPHLPSPHLPDGRHAAPPTRTLLPSGARLSILPNAGEWGLTRHCSCLARRFRARAAAGEAQNRTTVLSALKMCVGWKL